jgi:hypothetical protein
MPTPPLIRWSIQEIRRVAIRLARKQIQQAHIIGRSFWRRAHQAAAQRAYFKAKRTTVIQKNCSAKCWFPMRCRHGNTRLRSRSRSCRCAPQAV